MERLAKRSAQAVRQFQRRQAKRKKLDQRAEMRVDFNRRMNAYAIVNRMRVDARKKQREGWSMGPLAPQRDVPIENEFGSYFGALPEEIRAYGFGKKQVDLACKWAGGRRYLCIKPGDRVAIMEGPDKGKIAPIKTIQLHQGVVTLSGELMQYNTTLSEELANFTAEGQRVHLKAIEVPIQAIRLVHPLHDPVTATTRDVIIRELAPCNINRDKPTGRTTWSRVVPGLNIELPWPREWEDQQERELTESHPDHECDTLRIEAEKQTFVPTLLSPPMPSQVLDELRNRYSKFRTRHEPEYIAKITAQEEAKQKAKGKNIPLSMMTPMQEFNARMRYARQQMPEPELTQAMLIKIGRIMAEEDGRRFSGLSTKSQVAIEKKPELRALPPPETPLEAPRPHAS